MATKLGRMIASLDGLLPISHDPLCLFNFSPLNKLTNIELQRIRSLTNFFLKSHEYWKILIKNPWMF